MDTPYSLSLHGPARKPLKWVNVDGEWGPPPMHEYTLPAPLPDYSPEETARMLAAEVKRNRKNPTL